MSAGASCAPAAAIALTAIDDAVEIVALKVGRLSDEQVRALRRRRRTVAAAPTAAAAIMLLFTAIGPIADRLAAPAPGVRTFATRAGQIGTASLADGSTIRLNGATRVRVAFSEHERQVELLAGQAFFDVTHDPARPFVVKAAPGQARVLGTAFDLDLTDHELSLSVHRGAVGFGAAGKRHARVVRAGYRSRLREGKVEAPTRFDPALADWRYGWIDTDGMRLDDLVAVLRRQRSVKIEAPTGSLAAMRVAGRFRTDRPRELLRAIGDGFGFSVREKGSVLILDRAN